MRTFENTLSDNAVNHAQSRAQQPSLPAGRLNLVTLYEIQDLRHTLARGQVPPDLETKLTRLAKGNLAHRSIEQNCRWIIALLQAAQEGAFKEASPEDCERLLRVLAYVRKDDDATPDYLPDGFTDDQQEMRQLTTELNPLLQAFKSWRLQHQVPGMWR